MKEILKKIGLSEKEIAVYLVLVENGTRSASFIAKKSGLNRTTVYDILDLLIKKDLVYQTMKSTVKSFSAFPAEKLLEYLEKEAEKLAHIHSETENIIDSLNQIQKNSNISQPRFKYFEGKAGLRSLVESTLNTSEKQIYAVLSMEDLYPVLGEDYYQKKIKQQRIKKGIYINIIRSDKKDVLNDGWSNNEKQKRTVRVLNKKTTPPDMSFYLFDKNKVAFIASKKEDYGLLIESKEFYQTQKILFDALWSESIEKN